MKSLINQSINNGKSGGFRKEFIKNKALFLMILPGFVLFLLLSYLPMSGVLIAFKDMKFFTGNLFINFFKSDWVFFDNFRFFLQTPDAWLITRNTILYNLAFIILGNFLAIIFAICLDEIKRKLAVKFYQGTMLIPYFLSWVVLSYVLYGFLNPDLGFVNRSVLANLGMEPKLWYAEQSYWPFLLFLMNTLKYNGYNVVIYLAAIMSIDMSYYEAAKIDGATKLQQVRFITIPLLTDIMLIMVMLGLGRIFNADFGLFFQVPMESGALFNVTNVVDTYVFRALRQTGDIGMSSAAGLFQSVLGFICIMSANWAIRKIDREKAMF